MVRSRRGAPHNLGRREPDDESDGVEGHRARHHDLVDEVVDEEVDGGGQAEEKAKGEPAHRRVDERERHGQQHGDARANERQPVEPTDEAIGESARAS